jgi:hypothetical protein
VKLEGPRVLAGDGAIVSPSVERLRYTKRVAGYHGGATPQEVITPLVVLVPPGREIPGWEPPREAEPDWWLLEGPGEEPPASPALRQGAQTPLFAEPEPATEPPAWIDHVLESELYNAALGRAQRVPDRGLVVGLLHELDLRNFVTTDAAVARALLVPQLRVAGVVASIQQLLNVEGYQVLTRDRESGEIRLDRDLLRSQFGI